MRKYQPYAPRASPPIINQLESSIFAPFLHQIGSKIAYLKQMIMFLFIFLRFFDYWWSVGLQLKFRMNTDKFYKTTTIRPNTISPEILNVILHMGAVMSLAIIGNVFLIFVIMRGSAFAKHRHSPIQVRMPRTKLLHWKTSDIQEE